MTAAADQLALWVGAASLVFALAMAFALALLIARRRRQEHEAVARADAEAQASRHLVRAMASDEAPMPAHIPAEARIAALLSLVRLVRGAERERLLTIAEASGLFDPAFAALRHPRRARRIDALRLIEHVATPHGIVQLREVMRRDRFHGVRLEAAAALARVNGLPSAAEMIAALGLGRRPVTRLHRALFRSLARQDPGEIADLAASDFCPSLRPPLVESLGWSRDPAGIARIAACADDPDPEVRCAAIRAARQLAIKGAGRWIIPLLDDPEPAVRIQAAQACGELHTDAAIPALERLAADPHWWVRSRARAALSTLRPGGGPRSRLAAAT